MTDTQTPIPSILPRSPVDPSTLPTTGLLQGAGSGFSDTVGGSIPLINKVIGDSSFQGSTPLSQDDFANSIYGQAGVQYQDGMTQEDADRILQAHEDASLHAEAMARTSFAGKIGYFGGSLAGGLIDPINLLPLGALPEGASLLRAAATAAAVNTGLSVGVYSPLQQVIANKDQMPYGIGDWAEQAATGAALGAILGGIGHTIAPTRIPQLTEDLGKTEALSPNEQTVANLQRDMAELPEEITPEQFDSYLNSDDRKDANAKTVANLERDMAASGSPTDASGTPTDAAGHEQELESDLEKDTPQIGEATATDPAHLAFPDEEHQALYELNDQSTPDAVASVQKAFGLGDPAETLDLAQRYRDATEIRLQSEPNADGQIPAPTINSLLMAEKARDFTDPDLAGQVQTAFDRVDDPLTATAKGERENILQQVLSDRSKDMLQNDTGEIPTQQPKEGVLVQRDSRSNDGQVKEVSVSDWWRRQLRSVSTKDMGMRANATERLFNNLQRLTPEQFRWLAHEHMNDATLERLYKRYVDADDATPSRAVMAEDLLQAVNSEANRVPVATDLTGDVRARLDSARDAEIKTSLDNEMKDYREININDAMDRANGIDQINGPKDAAAYLKKTGYLDQVREGNQEAVRNIQDELTKLESKKSALIDAFKCMIGG